MKDNYQTCLIISVGSKDFFFNVHFFQCSFSSYISIGYYLFGAIHEFVYAFSIQTVIVTVYKYLFVF